MIPPAIRARMLPRLVLLYGPERAGPVLERIGGLVERWRPQCAPRPAGWSQRDAMLITYADSLLGEEPPLRTLLAFLRERVGDRLSFVHLLPFYPYSSDDGFAVEDFRAVRPDLGSWDDVAAFAAADYRPVFDAVVNHVSASSVYMNAYAAGDERFRDFFIALPPGTDTSSVLRTRDLPLVHEYAAPRGREMLWTTFGPDQLDLNYANPEVLLEVLDVLLGYCARGAAMLRLDAIPYLWKRLGTSCAHLPETHEAIRLLRDVLDAACPGALLLTETNVPHRENVTYFGKGGDEAQVIYNFALAPLVVHALLAGSSKHLLAWARTIDSRGPRCTYLNVTATHDGIGMRPTEGLLPEVERKRLVELARERGGDVTGKRNPDGSTSPYELNLNYFDAVSDPDAGEPPELQAARFMLSQALPLCLVGMPGIYIHSLLGSRGDRQGVLRTGRARSINRAQLRLAEIDTELADPASMRSRVFGSYLRLLDLRSRQPAFHPDAAQEVPDLGEGVFAVRRREASSGRELLALHSMLARPQSVDAQGLLPAGGTVDLLTGERTGDCVPLGPFQFRWLTAPEG